MATTEYESVIGLEVHVELATRTKLFCGCANQFGSSPNTLVCPVCLGLPGSLPVINRRAVELHLLAAAALGCKVPDISKFDRKNYFYPDMPKNFQTSQYDLPLALGGTVDIGSRTIGLTRIHLEEDTGKTVHYRTINGQIVPDRLASSEFSLVDYNRAGVPLLEIVSEPDLRTPEEASQYLQNLRDILVWLGISDCRMEEGSMRCDANVSVRPRGQEKLGVKTEIKNMNSFKSVRQALEYEIKRQIEVVSKGERIIQETRGWDEARMLTISMRSKEEAHDYRYFPEPDLPRLELASWPKPDPGELPRARSQRYVEQLGLSAYDADQMVTARDTAEFFDACVARGADAKETANWLSNEVARLVQGRGLAASALTPEALSDVVSSIGKGSLNKSSAKQVVAELVEKGGTAQAVIERLGVGAMSDSGELKAIVEKVVAENPTPVAEYRAGKAKALNVLVGQVMKHSKGRANPADVNKLLIEVLG